MDPHTHADMEQFRCHWLCRGVIFGQLNSCLLVGLIGGGLSRVILRLQLGLFAG